MATKIVFQDVPNKHNVREISDYGRHKELDCDCGKTCEAKQIGPYLYEWNCPECGLMRDTDA